MTPLEPADVLRRAHMVGTYYGFTPFPVAAHKRSGEKIVIAEYPGFDTLDSNARLNLCRI